MGSMVIAVLEMMPPRGNEAVTIGALRAFWDTTCALPGCVGGGVFQEVGRPETALSSRCRKRHYPGCIPHMLKPGSHMFTPPLRPIDLRDWSQWWRFQFSANWRRPNGRGRSSLGLDDHPAVHIVYKDAQPTPPGPARNCRRKPSGSALRTAGLEGVEFAWCHELTPGGRHMANTWQGEFPREDLATDGYTRTSPVGEFPGQRLAFTT
jgi:formylglycine-generating enzyme required for sulfatase activity